MKGSIKLFFIINFFTAVIAFTITGCKSSLLFFPNSRIIATPESIGLEYESINFITEDSIELHGWWLPKKYGIGTLLFCHGNAGNISHRLESIRIFNRLNLNVFIFDYRGYGKSSGKPSEKGTYVDAKAAWNYLVKEKNLSNDKIIIFGRSLGGAVAAWLAQDHKPGILILESTFTSAYDVASHHYRFAPTGMILGNTYNTAQRLGNISCPVLVIHSPDDEIVPYKLGKSLFAIANNPKEFVVIHGSHNSGFIESLDEYKAGLKRFILKYF